MFHDPAHWNARGSGPGPVSRRNSTPAGLSTTCATVRITRACSGTPPPPAAPASVSMQRSHSRR